MVLLLHHIGCFSFLFSHILFVRRRLGTWGAHVFVDAHVLSGVDYLSGICVSRYVVNISDFAILLFGKPFFRSLFRRMFFILQRVYIIPIRISSHLGPAFVCTAYDP